jgi:hypothetical protein
MPNPSRTVSREVSHLVRDRGFPQRRAVAASLRMRRSGELRGPMPPPRPSRRSGRR